jgi:hypothetical protein
MGDEQHRGATILPQAQHFVLHPHAREGVERAERFIEQENFGMIDQIEASCAEGSSDVQVGCARVGNSGGSNIVTGNHASAITPTADTVDEGATTIARGIHAVAGIGPTTFSTGIPNSAPNSTSRYTRR